MSDLEKAKLQLRKNWHKGAQCPCCGQMVKLYKRRIYGQMVADLIGLYRLRFDTFHHISKFGKAKGGDFAKLRYWGLIEEGVNRHTRKRTSGMWRITAHGIKFVESKLTVPEYCLIYNGRARLFEGVSVTIDQALGEEFNYEELMNVS